MVFKKMDKMEIANVVRFHRKKAKLSQSELGQLSGLGKTVIFDIEKGKLTVQLETLLKVLHVLNIKIELHSPLMALYREQYNENS